MKFKAGDRLRLKPELGPPRLREVATVINRQAYHLIARDQENDGTPIYDLSRAYVEHNYELDPGFPAVSIPDPPNQPKAPASPMFYRNDSAARKGMPLNRGCLRYFPAALALVSVLSRKGNEKHNPGTPLHWDKSKSADEKDAEVRHMLDYFRDVPPDPGLEPLGALGHLASKAWRALGDLQRACDAERAKVAAPKQLPENAGPNGIETPEFRHPCGARYGVAHLQCETCYGRPFPRVGDPVIGTTRYGTVARGVYCGVDAGTGYHLLARFDDEPGSGPNREWTMDADTTFTPL